MRTVIYKLNKDDEIVDVNDEWDRFALENDAHDYTKGHVLGQRLWKYITNDEVSYLYREMIKKVRQTNAKFSFPYRCDSPDILRNLEMEIVFDDNLVVFKNRIFEEIQREKIELFTRHSKRSSRSIIMCSWCKSIKFEDSWLSLQDGITKLNIFYFEEIPQISHGACPDCYNAMAKKLDDL